MGSLQYLASELNEFVKRTILKRTNGTIVQITIFFGLGKSEKAL